MSTSSVYVGDEASLHIGDEASLHDGERVGFPFVPFFPGQSRFFIKCPGVPNLFQMSRFLSVHPEKNRWVTDFIPLFSITV
jgi:hypothetical protein